MSTTAQNTQPTSEKIQTGLGDLKSAVALTFASVWDEIVCGDCKDSLHHHEVAGIQGSKPLKLVR